MNRGDTGLLPEEVLAIADATPTEFQSWHLTSLGRMLQQSATKYSTSAAMDLIRAGTRNFGRDDETKRRRTIDLLAAAGLVAEAYEFLPSLDAARAAADGALLIVHARYKLDLAAKAGDSPEGEQLTLEAFALLAEASLLDESTIEIRRDALKRAIALLNVVPRPQVAPWLTAVFANAALGPAALEAMALTASTLGDRNLAVEQRAKEILGLKESVDLLLARAARASHSPLFPTKPILRFRCSTMHFAQRRRKRRRLPMISSQSGHCACNPRASIPRK
jgi:hypothetical protein